MKCMGRDVTKARNNRKIEAAIEREQTRWQSMSPEEREHEQEKAKAIKRTRSRTLAQVLGPFLAISDMSNGKFL